MEAIKIVLASPSDLSDERMLISNTVKRKDTLYKRKGLTLDLRRWEDTTPGSSKIGAQGIIDDDLDIKNADVFICMYWEKVGTVIDELGETGTEHELNVAIDSFNDTGKPDIKFLLKKSSSDNPEIKEIAKKVQPIALYRDFETVDELSAIIDQIITDACNKYIEMDNALSVHSYKEVSTISEFADALGCSKTVIFHSGFYDLLCDKSNKFMHYEDVFDGVELIIDGVSDFAMIGNRTSLLVEPRYATAITFRNCDNLSISGFAIGHTPHKGYCSGGVLKFENCSNISLYNLELFGCGTYGIESNYSNNIYINGCRIFNCTYGALLFENSNSRISNSEIFECNNIYGI